MANPFFYADSQHTFFVEPTLTSVSLEDHEWFGVEKPNGNEVFAYPSWKDLSVLAAFPVPNALPPDPRAKYQVHSGGDWLTGDSTVVEYGGTLVGREGRHGTVATPLVGSQAEVNAVTGKVHLAVGGGRGMNIVGAGGVNSTLIAAARSLTKTDQAPLAAPLHP